MWYIESKYSRTYFKIIKRALESNRSKETGTYESHHIQPVSLLGHKGKVNRVLLTPKEHFICHLLLIKMVSGADKMKMSKAIWQMKSRSQFHTFSGKMYEKIRLIFSQYQGKISKQRWSNPEYKDNIIKKQIGRKNTEETKILMSESAKHRHKNKPLSREVRERIKEQLVGRKLSTEHIEAIRKSSIGILKPGTSKKLKGRSKEKIECPYCGKIGGKPPMMRYHFENCKNKL